MYVCVYIHIYIYIHIHIYIYIYIFIYKAESNKQPYTIVKLVVNMHMLYFTRITAAINRTSIMICMLIIPVNTSQLKGAGD